MKHSQAQKILNIVKLKIMTTKFGLINSDQLFYTNQNLLISMEIINYFSQINQNLLGVLDVTK